MQTLLALKVVVGSAALAGGREIALPIEKFIGAERECFANFEFQRGEVPATRWRAHLGGQCPPYMGALAAMELKRMVCQL